MNQIVITFVMQSTNRRVMSDITQIWKAYNSKLLEFIKQRVNSKDAEDILQEVFIKMYKRIGDLQDSSKLEAWIYQVTRNTIIDYYRTNKGETTLPDNFDMQENTVDNKTSEELAACLEPMINNLSDKYKNAVRLSEIEGKTQKEVSEIENISLSGAKSRVQRGRNLIKQMLEECCKITLDKYNTPIEYHPKSCNCNNC